mgnify:CR=1 FL=1
MTVFLGIMTAMAPLSTDMYLPALPELGGDFGISASLTQLTLTMTMLGMAFGRSSWARCRTASAASCRCSSA